MRALLLASLLVLTCLVPVGGASVAPEPPTRAYFEFDQVAVRPPATVEGVLVLTSREETTVRGSIVVQDPSSHQPLGHGGETPAGPRVLLEVEEELEAHSTVRVPFSFRLEELGLTQVSFDTQQDRHDVMVHPEHIYGLSPLEASLDRTEGHLVSVPGRPAEMTLTLEALPGANLTGLVLRTPHLEDVEVGNLSAGDTFTTTLTVEAEAEHGRSVGVRRSTIAPELSGQQDGADFTHPLFQRDGDRLEVIRPVVYVAQSSTAFILPPLEPYLNTPATIEVAVLNAGESPVRVQGRLLVEMPGMPHLRAEFPVDERVAAESVELVRLDWTPQAAGQWSLHLRHDLDRRGGDGNAVQVAGPISSVDLQFLRFLERGEPATVEVGLTASEDVEIAGISVTSSRAPQRGTISIDDLFGLGRVQGTSLDAGETSTLSFDLTPKATGSYDLYLVVETPEGPSVHNLGSLRVGGTTSAWQAAWSPTFLVGLLIGVHVVWRRNWVL